MQKAFSIPFLTLALLLVPFSADSQQPADASQATAVPPAILSPELDKAEAAMSQADWKSAEPILDTFLAVHPQDPRALFDAGYLADAENRATDAEALYRRCLAVDSSTFQAQISLGLLLARQNKADLAIPELRKATQLDPGPSGPTAKAKAFRALAHLEADMPIVEGKTGFSPASADLIEAIKLSPETPADTLLAAQLADRVGDQTTAETAWRRALKANPDSQEALAALCHSLISQKKYDEAAALLKPALEKSPDSPALTAQLAAILVAQDSADAVPLLQSFHQKHPSERAITRMLAQVLADAGEYADSDLLYVQLLADEPNDAALLTGHGHNLIRRQHPVEALAAFQKATEIDPTNGEAWNGVAFASFQTHQPNITIHALTVRSKYLSENPTIDFLWATAYDTLHQKKEAASYYHRFLETANGKFPDQEWQARQRLALLEKTP